MKLLVAIKPISPELVYKSLRWTARTGYDLKVFVPEQDYTAYFEALTEIADDHYLYFTEDNLVVGSDTMEYAKEHGYDLLVNVSGSRPSFTGARTKINLEKEMYAFAEACGMARKSMSENPDQINAILKPGIIMMRV